MSTIEILSWPFQQNAINQIDSKQEFLNYPVIYILNGKREAYIGETVNFKTRIKTHIKSRKNVDEVN